MSENAKIIPCGFCLYFSFNKGMVYFSILCQVHGIELSLSSFVLRVYLSASFLCIDPQIFIDFKACRNLSNLSFKHNVVLWVDKGFRGRIYSLKTGGLGT